MTGLKVLLLDIETAPIKTWVWGIYEQSPSYDSMVIDDWYVLCWAAKWLDADKMISSALPDYKTVYKKNPTDDKHILEDLWKLLDAADIVIAHNGDKFDIKKINARFMYHGMKPPSPFRSIDTLKIARRHFKFTSNRLDHLAMFFKIGRKESTGGFGLWKQICENQCIDSWRKMISYNKQDVVLLEQIYLKLRPWMSNHPNLGLLTDISTPSCGTCLSTKLHKRGFLNTDTRQYQRFVCLECGAWTKAIKPDTTVKALTKSAGRK